MADSTTADLHFKNTEAMSAPKPKQTKGRMKIPIKKIQNKNKKHVTFSKRRNGLFKKATELCVLCGASVAIITFSEAGKVFTFGHPTTDAVIRRYLNAGDGASSSSATLAISQSDGNPIEGGEDRRLLWWDRPVEELGFEELESYAVSLEQIRSRVEKRITELDAESHQLKLNVKTDFDYEYEHPLPIQAVPAAMTPMSSLMNGYYGFNNGVNGGSDPAIGSWFLRRRRLRDKIRMFIIR